MVKLVGKIPTDIRMNDVRSNDSNNNKKRFLLHSGKVKQFNGSIIKFMFSKESEKNSDT